jgi:hypothetical protein
MPDFFATLRLALNTDPLFLKSGSFLYVTGRACGFTGI